MNEHEREGELEEVEVELLVEGLYRHYGVDLRNYAKPARRQLLLRLMNEEGAATVSGLQERVLHESACRERLLLALSAKSVPMFRDPNFYLAFRAKVVPLLRTYPYVRLWLAGCATGEEAYSLAILLEEEGLARRCRVYATDLSGEAIRRARLGAFPLSATREFAGNYLRAGGRRAFSDYAAAQNGCVYLSEALKDNLVFTEHNLATDGSFNEFHVVLCRNVMNHFNHQLQERVHDLIYESLCMFGVVGLGEREPLRLSPREAFYETLDARSRLYRKVL